MAVTPYRLAKSNFTLLTEGHTHVSVGCLHSLGSGYTNVGESSAATHSGVR